ncbi:MBL fold metallo-hydrolase [Varibaculum vaginae]|uniref:MBL fold metallo-hydrolase n=1 Tax=Varibaculum vaginae TaxID=2364797 RepID=UPI000F079EDF|nr:MBL fold metallo-hydrolase [Varibaculum vaginae]
MRIEKFYAPFYSENPYLLLAEGSTQALIVDPGHGALEQIEQELSRLEVTVAAVLCTHGHADHIWDAHAVAGKAPVYIPAPDEYRFHPNKLDPRERAEHELSLTPWKEPENLQELPSKATSEGLEIAPGIFMRAVPAPGHTEGSTLFLFEAEKLDGNQAAEAQTIWDQWLIESGQGKDTVQHLALSGDVIFAGSVGRTDLPGGDSQQMLHTLRTLQNVINPDTLLLPGHGPATVFGLEKAHNPFLAQARYQG